MKREKPMKPFFEPLIRRWPSITSFGEEVGCGDMAARQWLHIDSVPAAWFSALRRAAVARGFHDITEASLAALAEQRRLAKVEGAPKVEAA